MHVIAVTGGKGGVGKTNLAVNLSVALSKLGRDVVLFDADLGLANVDLLMGLSVKYTLADVVSGEKTASEIIVTQETGVRVIPAASGIADMVELSQESRAELISSFSEQLLPTPDVMIVDTGAGIDQTVQTFVAACQIPVLVVCDEPSSLTDCYALIKVLRVSKNIKKFNILVNQIETPSQGKSLFERLSSVASKHLDVELSYLGAVPTDPYLKRAVQERRPLVTAYPRSPSALAIDSCAKRLINISTETRSSGMSFFLEKLLEATPDLQ
jgi:flagellar biosynthesis protein FlhG